MRFCSAMQIPQSGAYGQLLAYSAPNPPVRFRPIGPWSGCTGTCRPLIQCARGEAMKTMALAPPLPADRASPAEIRAAESTSRLDLARGAVFGEQYSEQHARLAGRTNG